MDGTVSLQIIDYVVIVLTLSVSLGVGVLFAVKDFRNANRTEYLLGGRRMFMLPVALSIFATFTSGISLMGAVTEIYLHGFMGAAMYIGMSLAYFLAMYTIVPLLYPLRLTSLYEYLELRFHSSALRMFVVSVGMMQTLCYMAISLLSPALALQAGANLPLWMSVGIVGFIGTVYSAIGGIKSVVWTDAFQSLVMLGGIFTIIIKGNIIVGGGQSVWNISNTGGRTDFTNFNLDPRVKDTWWSAIFGGIFFWMATICSQSSVQRISAMKSISDAKNALLINGVMLLVLCGLVLGMGWVMYAYFVHIRCDPFQAGFIRNANQLPPYFAMHALTDLPGMGGIYLSMIFSGSLSTLSSGISALAANTVEDFLKKPLKNIQESTVTFITKIFVFLYGVLIIGLTYGANSIRGPITQMMVSSVGACGGPVLGIFLLGAIVPWTNKYGAAGGGVIALLFNMWIVLGNQMYGIQVPSLPPPPSDMCFKNVSGNYFTNDSRMSMFLFDNGTVYRPTANQARNPATGIQKRSSYEYGFFLYEISYEWYGFIGTFVCLFFGIVISYCFRKRCSVVTEAKFLFYFVHWIWLSKLPDQKQEYRDEDASSKLINYKKDRTDNMSLNIDNKTKFSYEKTDQLNTSLNA